VSAWALNQLARRHGDLVDDLLAQSRTLVAAQTRALSGHAEGMRDAIRAHREALDAAIDATLAILGPRANDGFRSEIVSTLRAASTDDAVGRQLHAGRLVRFETAPGFPDATGLTIVPSPRPTPSPAKREPVPAKPTRADTREAERAAEAEREVERDAQRREHEARRERAAAHKAVADADADAARLTMRVGALEQELATARVELREARDRIAAAAAELARVSAGRGPG
jgi:hypothetical protein